MTYLDNFKRKRMKKYLLLLSALFFTGCLNVIGVGQKQDDSWQQPKDEKIVQNKEQISRNAIEILIPKCEEGDTEACNDLGVNYELLKEYENALTNYKKACDAKVQVGCANLGTLYELGLGVNKDEKRAYGIYKVACFRGLSKACPQMKRLGTKLGM